MPKRNISLLYGVIAIVCFWRCAGGTSKNSTVSRETENTEWFQDNAIIFQSGESEDSSSGAGYKELFIQMGHSGGINAVAFNPDGKHCLSGSGDYTIKLWDLETGREIKTFTGHTNRVTSIAFSPEGVCHEN